MKTSVQAAILIIAAFVFAVVANALASRDRKLVLPGYYPGARQVPKHEALPAPTAPTPVATAPPVTTSSVETATPQPITVTHPVSAPVAPAPAHVEKKPNPKPQPQKVARAFDPHPDKPYIEISGEEAAALRAQGALTLDARRTSVYEEGHIAGARSFSVWESDIDEKVNKLYEERSDPREQLKPILVYCSGGECQDSHMLAQKLWGVQFNNVYVYKDGFPDWQKRGGAIHKGSNP